jgi:hypothetical protein
MTSSQRLRRCYGDTADYSCDFRRPAAVYLTGRSFDPLPDTRCHPTHFVVTGLLAKVAHWRRRGDLTVVSNLGVVSTKNKIMACPNPPLPPVVFMPNALEYPLGIYWVASVDP